MRYIIKGDICYSLSPNKLETMKNGYLVCVDGISKGVYNVVPNKYSDFEIHDYTGKLVMPGLIDLHVHAPQYSSRSLGMDLELLDWLETYTFPEEAKYKNLDYAIDMYTHFVEALKRSPNTRSSIFATIHNDATILLMDMMEKSGLVSMVGKVNMDRNSPNILIEDNADISAKDTADWIEKTNEKYKNTKCIVTPRFLPSCSNELMWKLSKIKDEYSLPVQTHLSENPDEVKWVKDLYPDSKSYSQVYDTFSMFGGNHKNIMAHCVWVDDEEIKLMKEKGVFIAHCPNSNMNLSSGIAPIRKFMDNGLNVGLGSDIAGGTHISIFKAMSDAIQASKMYFRYVDKESLALNIKEAFYLGTKGGGSFFGKVGSFEEGYEFDAIVLDDIKILPPRDDLKIEDRVARVIYLADNTIICEKYVNGENIMLI